MANMAFLPDIGRPSIVRIAGQRAANSARSQSDIAAIVRARLRARSRLGFSFCIFPSPHAWPQAAGLISSGPRSAIWPQQGLSPLLQVCCCPMGNAAITATFKATVDELANAPTYGT